MVVAETAETKTIVSPLRTVTTFVQLIEQEASGSPTVPIPEPILDILRLWRPTPLYRARRLEVALGTPARIFYKYEGVSPAGSHKTNTSVAPVASATLRVPSLYSSTASARAVVPAQPVL